MTFYDATAKFDQCRDDFVAALAELHIDKPHTLYHYTSAHGMLSIIEHNRLWATGFQYLNDASELEYGFALGKQFMEQLLKEENDEAIKTLLTRSINMCHTGSLHFDVYITCFCEKDDVLNQWRVYSGNSQGYALGFTLADIEHRQLRNKILNRNQDFVLRKVIYDQATQKKIISDTISSIITTMKSLLDEQNQETVIPPACQTIRALLTEISLFFKHPAFSVEHEWRAIHIVTREQPSDIKFREGAYGLTPYVELDISAHDGMYPNKLPLESITAGPSRNPETLKNALRKMKEVKGLRCYISDTSLPVRL
ncbi:DUF2971 domain-containing protein [Pseudomonas serbica]